MICGNCISREAVKGWKNRFGTFVPVCCACHDQLVLFGGDCSVMKPEESRQMVGSLPQPPNLDDIERRMR